MRARCSRQVRFPTAALSHQLQALNDQPFIHNLRVEALLKLHCCFHPSWCADLQFRVEAVIRSWEVGHLLVAQQLALRLQSSNGAYAKCSRHQTHLSSFFPALLFQQLPQLVTRLAVGSTKHAFTHTELHFLIGYEAFV